jgi:hypothetical protein
VSALLSTDIALEVSLSVLSTPEARSPESLAAVADYLALQPRYLKRDVTGDSIDETFCNFFVREALRMLGVSIPRMLANKFPRWFREVEGGLADDWSWVQPWIGQRLANEGCPVVGCWENDAGPGHVVLLQPARRAEDKVFGRIWCAQAGAVNFAYKTLGNAFDLSRMRPVFFAHP